MRRLTTLLFVSAVAASCGKTKNADLELAAAEAALAEARKNRAIDCAKEIFMAAEVVLREAKELSEKGDFDAARAKAAEGESLANQARAASPPGCDKPEEEEEVNPDRVAGGRTDDVGGATTLEDALETIYFDYNQATIREDSKAVLTKVANILNKDTATRLEIEGHCDVRGSTEYNLHLGERRARSVMKYLVTQGVNPNQIDFISYGEERPVDLGDTESAHAKNRRAELKKR